MVGTVRCVIMRGGTSKGLYFHEADLPTPGTDRDRLLTRLMGSPDVLQIDGLGGSRAITSKVAVVSPSTRDDADIEYTFAQVEVDGTGVGHDANCGNISSGVGPFAVDEGLVPAVEPVTTVRIHNTNTDKVMIAYVPVRDGKARVDGDFAVPGVPGTGAEIVMDWAGTVGAKTGRLLPSGNAVDTITLQDGRSLRVTLCDAGNLVVWVTGMADEKELATVAGEVQAKALVLAGFCDDWQQAPTGMPLIGLVGLVTSPEAYPTLNGAMVSADEMDLRVRLLFMGRLHESIAGTASVCLAAASRVPGSVVETVAKHRVPDTLMIGHPSGITPARVRAVEIDEPPHVRFDLLGFSRTARRLMDGQAYCD